MHDDRLPQTRQEATPVHVFEDRSGRRRVAVRLVFLIGLLAVLGLAFDFALRMKDLPAHSGGDAALTALHASAAEAVELGTDRTILFTDGPSRHACSGPHAPAATPDRTVAAFLPALDRAASSSPALACAAVDLVLAETYQLDLATASVARVAPTPGPEAVGPDAKVFEVIGLRGGASSDALDRMLGSSSDQWQVRFDLNRHVDRGAVDGICLDLSNAPATDPMLLTATIRAWRDWFDLPFCVIGGIDARFVEDPWLIQAVDLVVLKAFAEPDRPTMPLASSDWVAENIARVTGLVPADKLVIAPGGFGYAWQSSRAAPRRLTYAETMSLMATTESSAVLNEELGTFRMRFVDDARRLNDVWLLDAATFYNQLSRLDPRQAVAIWPLGYEDPAVWSLLDPEMTVEAAEELLNRPVHLDHILQMDGRGPFLIDFEPAITGQRIVTRTGPERRTLAAAYEIPPRPNMAILGGAQAEESLYLTFEGLPRKAESQALLRTLSEAGIAATFFVDGTTILANPGLVEELRRAGHDIGILQPAPRRFDPAEISALVDNGTLHLLARETGTQTIFYRNQLDSRQGLPRHEQIETAARLLDRGQLVVFSGITAPYGRFEPAGFITRIRDEAALGSSGVITFELGPWNAANVVELLPSILVGLRSEGFGFRALHEGAGLAPEQAMPLVSEASPWRDGIVFGSLRFWLFGLTALFLGLVVFAGIRSLIYLGLAIWRGSRKGFDPEFTPPVTVIVPAFNEELVIERCIGSLLESDYPNLRIVIVDDGSTDQTYTRALTAFGSDDRVILLHQQNQGKWRAANHGLSVITTPYFIIADADSLFFPDTIGLLMQPFKEEKVGAVAGLVEVGNRENFITACQTLEYLVSQHIMRRAYEVFEGILVVPGAVGAWRTEAVMAADGFSGETITEDADLTVAVHRAGYRVRFQEQARAVTEAPATVRAFMRQRLRWTFGMFEVSWKHRGAIAERRTVGISIVDAIWFGLVSSLLSPLVDLLLIILLVKSAMILASGEGMSWSGLPVIVFVSYFILTGLDMLNTVVALRYERRFDWKLLALVPVLRFGYRQLLYVSTINAIWHALIGQMAGWNKLDRTGGVFRKHSAGTGWPAGAGSAPKRMEPAE